MPPRKVRYTGRRYRRRFMRKMNTVSNRVRKYVKRTINKRAPVELKQASANLTNFTISNNVPDTIYFTAPGATHLQMGSRSDQREANVIFVKGIRFSCAIMNVEGELASRVRFIVGRDKEVEGNALNWGLILTDVGAATTIRSQYQSNNIKERFVIYRDNTYDLNAGFAIVGSFNSIRTVNINLKFRQPVKVTYQNNSTTVGVGALDLNGIFMGIVCDLGTPRAPVCHDVAWTVYYTDG